MSEKIKFYMCPVSSMPWGENLDLEQMEKDLNNNDYFEENYEMEAMKYCPKVQADLDKGLIALVEVEDDFNTEGIEKHENDTYNIAKTTEKDITRTGSYSMISKVAFELMFKGAPIEDYQFVSRKSMKDIGNFFDKMKNGDTEVNKA